MTNSNEETFENTVLLTGHLACDPEFTRHVNGDPVAVLKVFENYKTIDRNSHVVVQSQCHKVVVHKQRNVQKVRQFYKRGMQVQIKATLRQDCGDVDPKRLYWSLHTDCIRMLGAPTLFEAPKITMESKTALTREIEHGGSTAISASPTPSTNNNFDDCRPLHNEPMHSEVKKPSNRPQTNKSASNYDSRRQSSFQAASSDFRDFDTDVPLK